MNNKGEKFLRVENALSSQNGNAMREIIKMNADKSHIHCGNRHRPDQIRDIFEDPSN